MSDRQEWRQQRREFRAQQRQYRAERRMERRAYRRGHPHPIRLVILIAIFVAIGFSMRNHANAYSDTRGWHAQQMAMGSQSYMSGLTVDNGETVDGDAVVYSGDATVKSGGAVDGNLVVYAGNATVEEGGTVNGDLTAWAGNVDVDGTIGGNVTALAGNVTLGENSSVGGDVSSLAGNLSRSDSATVGGNVLGKKQAFSGGGIGGAASESAGVSESASVPPVPWAMAHHFAMGPMASGFLHMVLNMFLAALLTVLGTLGAMAIYAMRPAEITRAQDDMRRGFGRSFVLGLVVSLGLWVVVMVLRVSFCLRILAFVPTLGLIALSLIGLTVVGRALGQRLLPDAQRTGRNPVIDVAAGSAIVAGAVCLLGVVAGGIGTLWTLLALVATAPGVGAFVEPWVDRFRNRGNANYSTPGAGRPQEPAAKAAAVQTVPVVTPAVKTAVTPVPPVPPVPPIPPVAPAYQAPKSVTPPVAEPDVDLAAVDVEAVGLDVHHVQSGESLSAVDAPQAVSIENETEESLLQAADAATSPVAEDYHLTLDEPQPNQQPDTGLTVDDLVAASDADVAAAQAAEAAHKAEAVQAAGEPPAGVDFTRIQGLGRSADRKLRSAGIVTFAQLAAAPVELVAAVLGVSVESVIEDEIQKQANALAQ